MPAASANAIQIEYESLGDPSAPAIVLIMGLGMQSISWPDPFCAALVERGFRVIRFDNRDVGHSTKMTGAKGTRLGLAFAKAFLGLKVNAPYSLEDMARDTTGLMDALGIERAHVVGASLGGMIAQVLAAKFPARVLSLTSIMSTSGNRKVGRGKPEAMKALLSRPDDPEDMNAVVDHLVGVFGVIGSPGYPQDKAEMRARVERSVRRSYYPAGKARQLLAVLASGDRRALLGHIKAPTLVIHGADDPLVPVAAGRDTAHHIHGAKLQIIPGMGHDLPPALFGTLATAIADHCRAAAAGP